MKMNTYYLLPFSLPLTPSTLVRSGASELAIANYQRQQLAVIYLVVLFFLLHAQFCCIERVRGSFRRGLLLLQLLFEFNLNVAPRFPIHRSLPPSPSPSPSSTNGRSSSPSSSRRRIPSSAPITTSVGGIGRTPPWPSWGRRRRIPRIPTGRATTATARRRTR